MFYYYKFNDHLLFSLNEHRHLNLINESIAEKMEGPAFFLGNIDPIKNRDIFVVSDASELFIDEESIDLLNNTGDSPKVLSWIKRKIESSEVFYVNTAYKQWQEIINNPAKERYSVNIIAIGDVGSTLLIGLKLLGKGVISEIGIYDRTLANQQRWEMEMNQVAFPFDYEDQPEVKIINESQLTDCDMLIFCAAKGYKYDDHTKDVRMIQFEANSSIISGYAKMVRERNFKGIFAVVSDPVDLLCKKVLIDSNTDESGNYDGQGLRPSQLVGYGLGVMNARALYHAKQDDKYNMYMTEGRAYGPHGVGLIIANSIIDYDHILSEELTDKAYKSNIEVRELGFKPFIAPALSSGAISIVATLKGDWHYSSNFIGGVFMGAKNKRINQAVAFERIAMPDMLIKRLHTTYENLKAYF